MPSSPLGPLASLPGLSIPTAPEPRAWHPALTTSPSLFSLHGHLPTPPSTPFHPFLASFLHHSPLNPMGASGLSLLHPHTLLSGWDAPSSCPPCGGRWYSPGSMPAATAKTPCLHRAPPEVPMLAHSPGQVGARRPPSLLPPASPAHPDHHQTLSSSALRLSECPLQPPQPRLARFPLP